ncbi:thiol peroxidase [Acidobacteria bacterium AH-259-O06]|nr:thiol peroxidase [Acidobacteria bacterium AH-259-L09]MDA2929819.1 thiol peroxidase [Acidobacteria bacterium AH-259-O06]
MSVERPNAVTLKDQPFTLVGPELKVGDKAPDFVVVGKDLKPVTLADTRGLRVFSVVPSLDTPVCHAQTRRFNEEAASLPDVKIYTVSMDLPFAQSRWCAASGVEKLVMLSDHRDAKFGSSYGTLIKELRLNSRAIFVIDEENTLRHVEYVKEVSNHPNYDAALEAVRKLTGTQTA